MKKFLLIVMLIIGISLIGLGVLFQICGLESVSKIGNIEGDSRTTVSEETENALSYGAIGGGAVATGVAGVALKKRKNKM